MTESVRTAVLAFLFTFAIQSTVGTPPPPAHAAHPAPCLLDCLVAGSVPLASR